MSSSAAATSGSTCPAPAPQGSGVWRAYLYADPASHSLSPAMHNAAFEAAGWPGHYAALRVPAAELGEAVMALRAPGVLGANLSLPHKEAVLPLLDELSPAARAIGAVNTIVNRQGHLYGDNTDAPGLTTALGLGAQGGKAVVLGAGGAARAAVYSLLIDLERDVYIVNRTFEKARQLAAGWHLPGAEVQVMAAAVSDIPWDEVDVLVNASSAGLNAPDETPLPDFDFSCLPSDALVYDMVYKPAETRLMRDARAAGRRAENGLGMLAYQARLAFTAWTGAEVEAEVFLRALAQASGQERRA